MPRIAFSKALWDKGSQVRNAKTAGPVLRHKFKAGWEDAAFAQPDMYSSAFFTALQSALLGTALPSSAQPSPAQLAA